MGYLDDVSGLYLTGEEVEKANGLDFEVTAWGRDTFKDGTKIVLVGKVAGSERRLVVNRTRKGEILDLLSGKKEGALVGRVLRLSTYITNKPGGGKGPAISISGFARK